MEIALLNPTAAELIATTEANYRAYFEGFACLPRCQLQVNEQFTWFIANGPPGNSVLRTQIAADEAPQRIEEMIQALLAAGAKSAWWQVLPSCQPANLAELLRAAGMTPTESRPVMSLDLASLVADAPLPPDGRIARVTNEALLRDWLIASAAGFEATIAEVQIYFDAYANLGFDPDGTVQHYVGYQGNAPVTSSTLLLAGGLAGIYDVSTAPMARGQGWGRAITRAALLAARMRGFRHAVLQASEEGQHLYARLGFTTRYHEDNYAWRRPVEDRGASI